MISARTTLSATLLVLVLSCASASAGVVDYRPPVKEVEDYVRAPLPPGFGVQHTDADGPVYTDSEGRTLYRWPLTALRNGPAGERKNGPPVCGDVRQTVNTGLMSPFPGGLLLPDLDTRPSCTAMWPPMLADEDAKPIGEWNVVQRPDGRKQWTFEGNPVYRSSLDSRPGHVNGASRGARSGDPGARREPIGPKPRHPPGFEVITVASGRLVTDEAGHSLYVSDADVAGVSRCDEKCLQSWRPVAAAHTAKSIGEWSVIERVPGVKQWAFRQQPVYTRVDERRLQSLEGSDVAGWHYVYTQRNPPAPEQFTLQDTRAGQILADREGRSVYIYRCIDDALDNLGCDHPASTQAYRFAVCGKGDAERCTRLFPYVVAPAGAKSDSLIWGTMHIDPTTGKAVAQGAPRALHVWTFRDRPVYTHALDRKPGDINADGWGEYNGWRNGYKGFFVRDDFLTNAN